MILKPAVTIAIVASKDSHHDCLLVRRTDSNNIHSSLHLELGRVEREGFHALCQSIGHSVVYALARAHPDVFAKYPLLLLPPPTYKDPHEVTTLLLYRAGRENTGDYTQALDALFKRYAEELAGLAESWAMLRATLPAAGME